MKVDLPDESGATVISLSVVRESSRLARQFRKTCPHAHVTVDTSLSEIICDDCEQRLNPVEWIALLVEEWACVERKTQAYVRAKAEYEGKQRCRCEHCGRITSVKPRSAAQVRRAQR